MPVLVADCWVEVAQNTCSFCKCGYAYNSDLGDGHKLHAGMEVWLSGAVVSFDPCTKVVSFLMSRSQESFRDGR